MRELAETGGALAFVGDGINDAAALGAADVAVAVGGGADVAVLSADVVLAREGSPLSAMPALLQARQRDAARHRREPRVGVHVQRRRDTARGDGAAFARRSGGGDGGLVAGRRRELVAAAVRGAR